LPAAQRLPQREQSHHTTATNSTTECSSILIERAAVFFATFKREFLTEQPI
jgi:hypothetical protein